MRPALAALGPLQNCRDAVSATNDFLRGFRRRNGQLPVRPFPVADGGESMVEVLRHHHPRARVTEITVPGPFGMPVQARVVFLTRGGGVQAVLPSSEVLGRAAARGHPLDPLRASSHGLGLLIDEVDRRYSPSQIFVITGDSVTMDPAGVLRPFGVVLRDKYGYPLSPGGGSLVDLVKLDFSGLRTPKVQLICVSNFSSTLNSVPRRFSRQKGATTDAEDRLAAGFERFAEQARFQTGSDLGQLPGGGGSGGISAALSLAGARIIDRDAWLSEILGVEAALDGASCVFLAEGRFDASSRTKLIGHLTRRAKARGLPVIAVVGDLDVAAARREPDDPDIIWALPPGPMDRQTCLSRAQELLEMAGEGIGASFGAGRTMFERYRQAANQCEFSVGSAIDLSRV